MHEWGITQSIIDEVIKQAHKNGLKKIDSLSLCVGEQDHLTVDSVKFCFKSLAKDTMLANTELKLKKCSGTGIVIEAIQGQKND